MRSYRTIREIEEEYLRNHPEETDDYMAILSDEYAEDGKTAEPMLSLSDSH
jgi:hypothetical protein